jgi:hypothetical protein
VEQKYLKDFVIVLVVIMLLAFGIKTSSLYKKIVDVPDDSKYQKMGLGEKLLHQIQEIDTSIRDRKNFYFTVEKDPLEQNLIVKTQKDLEKQWREKVESLIRLEMTILPEIGEKKASISYKGMTTLYGIGDKFELGTNFSSGAIGMITDIQPGMITYKYNGKDYEMKLSKIPPKPAKLKTVNKAKSIREYNW